MKKATGILLLACMMVFSLSMNAQEKKAYAEKTTKIENTQMADLHQRGYSWLNEYFGQAGKTIENKDVDENYFTATVKTQLATKGDLTFKIRFDLKDNEYSYKVSNLSMADNSEVKAFMEELEVRIKRAMITTMPKPANPQK